MGGARAFIYFLCRYILRGGFLAGRFSRGAVFSTVFPDWLSISFRAFGTDF
jgi:hypothetical protein